VTSIDAAQQAGLPLLTDKLWFHVATTWRCSWCWHPPGTSSAASRLCSFGNIAFFGLAPIPSACWSATQLAFGLALIVAPGVAALFALIIGPRCSFTGHYFAGGHTWCRVAVGEVVNNVEPLGASSGITSHRPLRTGLLLLDGGCAILAALTTWSFFARASATGCSRSARTRRPPPSSASNTTLYKVAAFCIAAALSGLAAGFLPVVQLHQPGKRFRHFGQRPDDLMGGHRRDGTVLGPVAGPISLELIIQRWPVAAPGPCFLRSVSASCWRSASFSFPWGYRLLRRSSKLSLRYFRQTLRETSA